MLAFGVRPLESQDARLITGQRSSGQIHLQLTSRRVLIVHLQIDVLHGRGCAGTRADGVAASASLARQAQLDVPHGAQVGVELLGVLRADDTLEASELGRGGVEHALALCPESGQRRVRGGCAAAAADHVAEQYGEHVLRIFARRNGLIGRGIRDARAHFGVAHVHAELQALEGGLGRQFRRQELIERLTAPPTRSRGLFETEALELSARLERATGEHTASAARVLGADRAPERPKLKDSKHEEPTPHLHQTGEFR